MAGIELDQSATGHEMSNQQIRKTKVSPNINLDHLGKTARSLQLCSFTFLHRIICIQDHFRPCWLVADPKLWFLRSCLLRIPKQANLPLHDGWHRTGQMCHCSWNVKSTIRKAKLPQHKPGSPWENWSLPTNFPASLFGTLWPFQTLRASGYLQLRSFTCLALQVLYVAWSLCCRYAGPNTQNNKHSLEEHLWHVASTTSTVASLRVARLGWLPTAEAPNSPKTKMINGVLLLVFMRPDAQTLGTRLTPCFHLPSGNQGKFAWTAQVCDFG